MRRAVRPLMLLETQRALGSDDLERFAVLRSKACTQRLVPTNDFVKAALECVPVHIPVQPQNGWKIVCRTARRKLIKKPQSLLRKRERSTGEMSPAGDAFPRSARLQ